MTDNEKGNIYFVKCKIKSSFRDVFYFVHVAISVISGAVLDASCVCKASSMGRCSHIAALLIKLDDFVKENGHQLLACTSLPCAWNTPKNTQKNPKSLREADYASKSKFEQRKHVLLDFHPAEKNKQSSESEKTNSLLSALRGSSQSGWSTLLNFKYSDYDITDERKHEIQCQRDMFLNNLHELVEMEYNMDNTMTNEPLTSYLVPGTCGQNIDDNWSNRRSVLITASIAKEVANSASQSTQMRILQRHLWRQDFHKNSAIIYGIENESNARRDYENALKTLYPDVTVSETGLWVSLNQPEIGCSPDGLVTYTDEEGQLESGLVELKCPYVLRNADPSNINQCKTELSKKQQSTFCCRFDDSDVYLKSTHAYYYQIQLQLFVLDLEWCDFVLWSAKGIHRERIHANHAFLQCIIPKLIRFHHTVLVPEYFEKRIPRKLQPICIT